jgi:hypothetical protein
MADITLTSNADPADYTAANGSSISIRNAVIDSNGVAAATTLSCDRGLFTPASDFPMAFAAGEEKTVRVGTSDKDYYYNDPTKPEQGTRSGKINPG